jgi:hypothetical protein
MRVPHATPQVGIGGWEYTFFFPYTSISILRYLRYL